ncbi:MAG: tetratricopeptide repeat protein [Bryobacterales bacterium]|nr:tetratricopeptide repeat protein [Bryobacterales bacterium]
MTTREAILITLAALVLVVQPALANNGCEAGAAAARQRDFARAETELRRCIQSNPSVEPYLMLAGVYQLQQNTAALYALSVEATEKFPEEQRFYLVIATQDGRQGRFAHAIKVLESARSRWPDDPKVKALLASSHFGMGTAHLNAGESEAAVSHLRTATDLAPGDTEAQVNLGRALHNIHQRLEALAVFDRLVSRTPPVPLARFHRALTHYSLGEFALAIEDLNQELESNSGYPPAHLVRGLSYIAIGDWKHAATDLEIAVRAMPDHPQALYARARTLIEFDELDHAEKLLRKTIALDAEDPAPLNTLIRVLVRLGRRDEARSYGPRASALSRKERTANPGEISFGQFSGEKP